MFSDKTKISLFTYFDHEWAKLNYQQLKCLYHKHSRNYLCKIYFSTFLNVLDVVHHRGNTNIKLEDITTWNRQPKCKHNRWSPKWNASFDHLESLFVSIYIFYISICWITIGKHCLHTVPPPHSEGRRSSLLETLSATLRG